MSSTASPATKDSTSGARPYPRLTWSETSLRTLVGADAAYAEAQERDAKADEQVREDSAQAREAGWIARVRYRFSDDRATVRRIAAETEEAKQEVQAMAERLRTTLREEAAQQIADSPIARHRARLQADLQQVMTQQAPTHGLRTQIAEARNAAADAERAIASAESAETLDAVSQQQFATLYSSSMTSAARAAIGRLREELTRLQADLTKTADALNVAGPGDVSLPDDTVDLVLDFSGLTDGFDWSSWLALSQLSSAKTNVRKVQASLETLATAVARRAAPLDEAVAHAQSQLEAFEAEVAQYIETQLNAALEQTRRHVQTPRRR